MYCGRRSSCTASASRIPITELHHASTFFVLSLVAAAFLIGCQASSQPRLETGRPRLFFRETKFDGGLSVGQLRERATTQPLAGRGAPATYHPRESRDEVDDHRGRRGRRRVPRRPQIVPREVSTSDEGTELVDVALAYDWLFRWKGFSDADKKAVAQRMADLGGEMIKSIYGDGSHIWHTRMYAWARGRRGSPGWRSTTFTRLGANSSRRPAVLRAGTAGPPRELQAGAMTTA